MGNIKEVSPFMSPDSLRGKLQIEKRFYDLHTKKNFGREDIRGSQFYGVTENFGNEILVESRKLLQERPPLKNLFEECTFYDYFDIEYSHLIDTYDQQSLLIATVKENSLIDICSYSLKFTDCHEEIACRDKSWGSYNPTTPSDVCKDKFYRTSNPPVLEITDIDGNVTRIPLIAEIGMGFNTDYLFHVNATTLDLFTTEIQSNHLITVNVDNITKEKFVSLPLVWLALDIFKIYPQLGMIYDDEAYESKTKQCLSIGTDGQDIVHIYPLTFENEDFEDIDDWFIKVYSESFNISKGNPLNYTTQVDLIEFNKFTDQDITQSPSKSIKITYDTFNAKISLSKRPDWSFKIPHEGDYDYNPSDNKVYAIIPLKEFIHNLNENDKLIEGFDIAFSEVLNAYDGYVRNNTYSGIHVDVGSDYSDNAVNKDYGIIHSLEQFDGLPNYFNKFLNRNLHRSRVEVYTIREGLRKNEEVTEHQTAALIFDSAIPQTELKSLISDMPTVIYYNYENKQFDSHQDQVISETNSLSEITFEDLYNFGHKDIAGDETLDRFIYHGKRTFSLGVMEYDPDTEIARVYLISNDPIKYENNKLSTNPKSPRTIARICDIPTEYGQLIHIKNVTPTRIFDPYYVRSTASLTHDDLITLWNDRILYGGWVTKNIIGYGHPKEWIFFGLSGLNNSLTKEYLSIDYALTSEGSLKQEITFTDLNITINKHGTNYAVGDKFYFEICGNTIDCEVKSVNGSTVTDFEILKSPLTIPKSNFISRITYYPTSTQNSSGKDLEIRIEISETIWDSKVRRKLPKINEDVFGLYTDSYGFLWIASFSSGINEWVPQTQLTGERVHENIYDKSLGISDYLRTIQTTMMFNMLSDKDKVSKQFVDKMYSYIKYDNSTIITLDDVFDKSADYSNKIIGHNKQNTLYVLAKTSNDLEARLHIYEYASAIDNEGNKVNPTMLPRFNTMNLSEYYNKSNAFSIIDDNSKQPHLYVYSPTRDYLESVNTSLPNTKDSKYIDHTYPITIKNIIDKGNYSCIDNAGELITNVYWYNDYKPTKDLKTKMNIWNVLTNESLKREIRKLYGDNSYIVDIMESSKIDNSILISYLAENYMNEPVYAKNELSIFRRYSEKVISSVPGTSVVPVGEQPVGQYIDLTSDSYNINVNVNKNTAQMIPSNIFLLEDLDGPLTSDFRIIDDENNDISKSSILIVKHEGKYTKYIFSELNNSWVILN